MKPRTLLVARRRRASSALPAAGISARAPRRGRRQTSATGQLVFPDLAPKLAARRAGSRSAKGKTTVIEKRGDGLGHGVDRGDYPVQAGQTARHADRPDRTAADRTAHHRSRRSSSGWGWTIRRKPATADLLLQLLDAAGKPIAGGDRRPSPRAHAAATCRRRSTCAGPATTSPGWPRASSRSMPTPRSGSTATSSISGGRHGSPAVAVTNGDATPRLRAPGRQVRADRARRPPAARRLQGRATSSRAFEFLTFNDVKPGPSLPGDARSASRASPPPTGRRSPSRVNRDGGNAWASFAASGGKDGAELDAAGEGLGLPARRLETGLAGALARRPQGRAARQAAAAPAPPGQ